MHAGPAIQPLPPISAEAENTVILPSTGLMIESNLPHDRKRHCLGDRLEIRIDALVGDRKIGRRNPRPAFRALGRDTGQVSAGLRPDGDGLAQGFRPNYAGSENRKEAGCCCEATLRIAEDVCVLSCHLPLRPAELSSTELTRWLVLGSRARPLCTLRGRIRKSCRLMQWRQPSSCTWMRAWGQKLSNYACASDFVVQIPSAE